MFTPFLFNLRSQGLVIGVGEWVRFLEALKLGLATDVDGLYRLGRAVMCRSENEYDAYDVAFAATFEGAELPEDMRELLTQWLSQAAPMNPNAPEPTILDPEALWREFLKRLAEQKGQHSGGNHWIGTGGTSPFGHSGRNPAGMRVGGASRGRGGGGRSGAVDIAMERRWANYRADRVLDVRDLQVALRALRNLRRDGPEELDLDQSIRATCDNAGDIELVFRPERKNQVHVVLLMDAGGSMAPHAAQVERLFTAASRIKSFKSFKPWFFHNCVYERLYSDIEQLRRVETAQVLRDLTPRHRLVFVGDASMAPYELFHSYGWIGRKGTPGIDWLKRFARKCRGSVWLNPDPQRYWNHPTVSAIGKVFPMYPLTLNGLREAVKTLRAPI